MMRKNVALIRSRESLIGRIESRIIRLNEINSERDYFIKCTSRRRFSLMSFYSLKHQLQSETGTKKLGNKLLLVQIKHLHCTSKFLACSGRARN